MGKPHEHLKEMLNKYSVVIASASKQSIIFFSSCSYGSPRRNVPRDDELIQCILKALKFAMQLVKAVYELTAAFPAEERYGLAQQTQRAAASIPGNIAEGAGRNSTREFLNFIGISRGSQAELEPQLQLSVMLGLAVPNHPAFDLADRTGRLLTGLNKKWSTT